MAITRIKAETALSGTIPSTNISESSMANVSTGTSWQSVITADGSTFNTAVAGEGYFIDTTSATHTLTLPASPSAGDEIHIIDYAGTFGTNAVTVARNGSNIDGVATNATLGTNRLNSRFVYVDSTQGWKSIIDDVSTNYGSTFISATGGTITTSGDFKIHTFTGDGCFVVSSSGNPSGGGDTVSYVVVAGGGSGGADVGGGGGAGGFRESKSPFTPYTASPLASTVGLTVSSSTTYPITVGGGGSAPAPGASDQGTNGNPSIFSTITSTAGGAGGGGPQPPTTKAGNPGGSGGGGGGWSAPPGNPSLGASGSGNTPPVSPPQGNNGGQVSPGGSYWTGAGGGGAGSVGQDGIPQPTITTGTRAGGCGVASEISGSPVTYAAGGSGGNDQTPGPSTTVAGANSGGGGGGAGNYPTPNRGNAGGSGVVIIRYKYQ